MRQQAVDESNAAFWNTLCGWNMAREAGITGDGEDDLRRFDDLYLSFYPYLERYIPADLTGKRVLEAGLGFGTLGQLLASRGADYYGIDIAPEPVAVMRKRLRWLDLPEKHVQQASVLELPFDDETFDEVYSIGCLHHTGDLPRAVAEVLRVLRMRGRAVVMVYNRHSARRLLHALRRTVRRSGATDRQLAAAYDVDEAGVLAPHTDFVSRSEARRLFRAFSRVRIDVRNFDDMRLGPLVARREQLLENIARIAGLDLYITAEK